MKRFGFAVMTACVLLLLLCVGAIVMGRVQPASEIISGLRACAADLPCYQGIVVDSTSLEVATSTLEQLPSASPSNGASVLMTSGPVQKVLIASWSEKNVPPAATIVRELDLYLRDNATSIAGIVAGLGMPCGVYPVQPRPRDPLMLQIVYPQLDFWVQTDNWMLDPGLLASQIDIGPTAQQDYSGVRSTVNRCLTDPSTFYEWRGFSRYPLK